MERSGRKRGDEETVQVNAVLKQIVETGYTKTLEGESLRVHSSISADEGLLLQGLIKRFKPTITLQIGLAFGVSALYICEALEVNQPGATYGDRPPSSTRIPGVETDGRGSGDNLRRPAMNQGLIHRPSSIRPCSDGAVGEKIDFCFYRWLAYFRLFPGPFFFDNMLRVGGIVVFDDADWASIRKLCRYVLMNLAYEVVPLVSCQPLRNRGPFSRTDRSPKRNSQNGGTIFKAGTCNK